MDRRLTPEERDAKRTLRKCRDLLNNQMEGYDDPNKFPTNDANKAVMHSYSILARYEEEYDIIPDDDTFIEELEEIAIKDYEDKTVTIPMKEYDLLVKKNARLQAKINRVTILNSLSRANRVLAQQMVDLEKIVELQKRQKFIDIQIHASILVAYNDMVYLSLRRIGLSDKDIQEFANQLKSLERDYPLLKMNNEELVEKLTTGKVPKTIDADYEVIKESPYDKLNEIDKLI